MSKKIRVITILVFFVLTASIFMWQRMSEKRTIYTFEQVIGCPADHIASAEGTSGEELMSVVMQYQDQSFVKYKGDLGNTAHREFVLYDAKKEKIAVITEMGNSGIFQVSTDHSEDIYKVVDQT